MDEETGKLGSTRSFETNEGTLTYTEVSERLAVSLARILAQLLQTPPHEIIITPDWLCQRHRELAGRLFPEWAGRFRITDVKVGTLEPPAYYKVPLLVRSFCDDLAERLRHVDDDNLPEIAAFLAWVDWRFQWVHPFKDFNGRIGRLMLAALLYKLALPPVETAPTDPEKRREYLEALRAGDAGNLDPLQKLWIRRFGEAI
ncbi:MAG: Fic family protein [Candidatus Jettenia sp.]|nr:Fic family protein [Candidatus Jettenia sp.]